MIRPLGLSLSYEKYKRKSFDQTFSKVCGFQRQRLWPLSAESGIFLRQITQEGVKKQSGGLFLRGNPRRGFPLCAGILCCLLKSHSVFDKLGILPF